MDIIESEIDNNVLWAAVSNKLRYEGIKVTETESTDSVIDCSISL